MGTLNPGGRIIALQSGANAAMSNMTDGVREENTNFIPARSAFAILPHSAETA